MTDTGTAQDGPPPVPRAPVSRAGTNTTKESRGTQTVPCTPAKRTRTDSDADGPSTPKSQRRLTINVTSPTGPKVVHVNARDYVVHMNDILADPWVSEQTTDYLYKFITYNNKHDTRFHIHHLPTGGMLWSVVDENPRVMHRTYLNRPLLIWIVASVIDATLKSTRDHPQPRMRIVADFVRERDRKEAMLHFNKTASYAIQKMPTVTVESASNDDEGPPSEEEVYDAREKFEDKAKMKTVSIAKVRSGDIVLLECNLVRTEDNTGRKEASFVLNAVYWLAEKPRDKPAPPLYKDKPFPEVFCAAV
ncbi:hypothetical protein OH76DRAFT_1490771 [Lentinus brumalis]|uniref:Uncharacterized protein n=1 Tax=Lentinus brumalis TaxID=2498619 RepID=A0A371CHW0_9APHY|nr:hypothetical protein OH76DRAFT_1424075 [Polyporus brumalis]RDX39875.1 hypothetical protein OH76DRAFT_1490771 [Polyporus brumalis]